MHDPTGRAPTVTNKDIRLAAIRRIRDHCDRVHDNIDLWGEMADVASPLEAIRELCDVIGDEEPLSGSDATTVAQYLGNL